MSKTAPLRDVIDQGAIRTVLTLRMIKVSHSVFALPFALAAMLLAAGGLPPWRTILWIVVAMLAARSAAMAFNRVVDREFDRRNPRTAGRELPAGTLPVRSVKCFVAASVGVFLMAAAMLNRTCLLLAPVALAILLGYSYAKRFTAWCHGWLGLALGIAPCAAWLAVRDALDESLWIPSVMGAGVVCWVAGFDIIYSCQDIEPDRAAGLHSLPARWGETLSLRTSLVLHLFCIAFLALLVPQMPRRGFYVAGLLLISVLLCVEQTIARSRAERRVEIAFFHVNSAVGLVYLAAIVGEVA